MVRYAVGRGCFNIVGAVDPDPEKAGKDLGELCGINPLGISISSNLDDAIKGEKPEVAIVTTVTTSSSSSSNSSNSSSSSSSSSSSR